MSKRKRFLYIICTLLLALVVSYSCHTGCNLELPESEGTEQVPGGDSP